MLWDHYEARFHCGPSGQKPTSPLAPLAKFLAAGEPSSLPADKLLQLAETMAMRSVSAGEALSYEELLLLLDILHGQGKHAEALQVGTVRSVQRGFVACSAHCTVSVLLGRAP